MKMFQTVAGITILVASLAAGRGQGNSWTNEIPVEQARAHVHERATVFGRVYHVSWDSNVYLDFGGFYSEAVFSAIVPGANELVSQLGQLEGKEIVVHGRITTNSFGIPQIRVRSAATILLVGPDNYAVPLDFSAEPPAGHTNTAPKQSTTAWLSVFAADPDETNTFVTLAGRTYANAKVIQVEPDGLTIKYAPEGSGLSEIKLTFDELPQEVQQLYGFDPQLAAAYANERQLAAGLSDEERHKQEWQARHEELIARSSAARLIYERKKRAYEEEKSDYDAKFKRGDWQDAERKAEARELEVRETEYQSALRQQQLIEQQQQLMLKQQTNK